MKKLLFALAAVCLLAGTPARAAVRMDVIEFSSKVLKGNPLHDPVVRRLAVFVPDQATNPAGLPIVYYLPGYGSSSDKYMQDAAKWRTLTKDLARDVTPMILVIVDGRNRWGGSQYLNSPAQGNYANYICDEIVPLIEARYSITTNHPQRVIAGHSSGGFGALRLGLARPKLFDGVVALSPDCDFQSSHLPMVKVAEVTNVPLSEITNYMATDLATLVPTNYALTYILGLSAAYAPVGWWRPGQFEWLYDAQGRFQENVWQRWLANDPLVIVQRDPNAFRTGQSVYLEGAALDEYGANIGARKIYEAIKGRPARSTFYEPPGTHGAHRFERIARGLAWAFDRPTAEVPLE